MSAELRLCSECSHLYREHVSISSVHINGVLVAERRGACDCCDCPAFVDEPDYLPSPRPPAPRSGT